ncbi:M10 family metallopeptidase C-terminal domain-containing protein [Pseudaestuariivita atlantica]|uniref:M10 family metallopeptidase C-terminal domain-containing protein n=1 Tax=Pseudaestuariivita atlantica TaxID=1317121 RepID=UPI00067B5758|nr:M10 family metallopeptidase C-terminal domain-containing protein [Pseudaestuariivita atlantica]
MTVTSLHAITGMLTVQATYDDAPQLYLDFNGDVTSAGLSIVDLGGFLPSGSSDFFDAQGVFQGGNIYVSPEGRAQEFLNALAFLELGFVPPGLTVNDFLPEMDTKPAEAAAYLSDGSGAGETGTLYLAIRGTDNLVDATIGGQSFSPSGQAEYFMMLKPFFDAARDYALANGIDTIVVTGHSLGGAVADLFSLFLKEDWDADFATVSVVSVASPGLAPGVSDALGALLGVPPASRPQADANGEYTRPDGHMNFANSEDIVSFPEVMPQGSYLVADVLRANQSIADPVVFDQTAFDGTDVDLATNTYGDEHGDFLYTITIAGYYIGRPDISAAEDAVGTRVLVGDEFPNTLTANGEGHLLGYLGNDLLIGSDLSETLQGGDGDDTLEGFGGADWLLGGQGTDIADYSGAGGRVLVDLQSDVSGAGFARFFDAGAGAGARFDGVENVTGGAFADNLRGDGAANVLSGGGVSDRLYGRAGNDTLDGGAGADAFYGNLGADEMTGGPGAVRDRFIYFQANETGVGPGNRDVITDFTPGEDRIELSRIDADITQGFKQRFDFVGDAAFSGTAGELRFEQQGGITVVQADRDGDGVADMEIELTGTHTLTVDDFLI